MEGFEEKLINALNRIRLSINALGHTLTRIDEQRRFPVEPASDEFRKEAEKRRKEQRETQTVDGLQEQNATLRKQNRWLFLTFVATAILALIAFASFILQ